VVSTCESFTAEFFRRDDSDAAKTDPALKHTPFVLLNGSTATIVVGEGATTTDGSGLIHPMSPSDDPAVVHWISHIFATDEAGNLVAMCELLPTDPAPASCTFEVPQGVQKLIPYEFCNKHGFYVGDEVAVTETNLMAPRSCHKRECSEAQPSLLSADGDEATKVCTYWRAELQRRQIVERGEATEAPYDSDLIGETKHKPYVRIQGTTAVVVVGLGAVTGVEGDLIHPMTDSEDSNTVHWIDTVWAEDQNGRVIGMRRLSPLEPAPAMLSFPIPYGTTAITGYEHCNKHGLYKGQTVVVAPAQTVSSPQPSCDIATCGGGAANVSVCPVTVAEYWRLYEREFTETAAVDGNTNLKHKPSVIVHGNGSVTVQVGHENVQTDGSITYHPMSASDDKDIVHWINSIWVADQTGSIIAMREFLPTDPSPATFTFDVPAGTTKLTAFEYCNKHGLFAGDEITLSAGDADASVTEPTCDVDECPQETVDFAREVDCLAFIAEAKRRQIEFNAYSPTVYSVPYTLGTDNEKHSPYIVLDGLVAKVVVGRGAATGDAADPIHPMTDNPANYGADLHYIESIWVEDQNGEILSFRSLSPSESSPATMYFDIPVGTTSVTAYEFCNKHGLFQGPTVTVTPDNTRLGARTGCSVQQCVEGTGVSTCQAFTAEFWRREGSATAKSDSARKHEPFLLLNGTTATIVVGEGAASADGSGLIHPMAPSDDPNTVHWISHIFARDEMGNLVALCELLPTHPAPASCTFEVPPGVLSLRPFEFCNKHGLYVGQTVTVLQSNPSSQRSCVKRECSEAQPSLSSSALTSVAVDNILDSQEQSVNRISTINMCLEHRATFSVLKSAITDNVQDFLDRLVLPGDAASDTERRLFVFDVLMPILKERGGQWHGLPEVIEHLGLDSDKLRTDLTDVDLMRFTARILPAGAEAFADGVDDAIKNDGEELLIIEASFGMNWGYPMHKALGAHYTFFYNPDFENQVVSVAMCAKTLGWMGIGWLTPDHIGHYMNYTDMNVVFVNDAGEAVVQDRFAFRTEEPVRDERLPNQRVDASGNALSGHNDLTPYSGALGTPGKEWCPDSKCEPGFTLVQFQRPFRTNDTWDARLPVLGPKIGLIFAFATVDPTDLEMVEHIMSSAGYHDIVWNKQCEAGTYFNDDRVECISCDPGYFRPETAPVSKCLQCLKGSYQDETGSSQCKQCKAHFTTAGIGATQERECSCSGPTVDNLYGWYHVPTCGTLGLPEVDSEGDPASCTYLGECRECPEGMTCAGGWDLTAEAKLNETAVQRVTDYCTSVDGALASGGTGSCSSMDFCSEFLGDSDCMHSRPMLKEGFSSRVDDPLRVFMCWEPKQCPGGEPGTCAPFHDTTAVACAACVENAYLEDGNCKACEGISILPFVAVVIAGCFGAGLFSHFVNKQVFMRVGASTTAGILAGTMFSAMQTLSTFASLEVNWIQPMKGFMKAASVLSFDLEVVRIGCVMAPNAVTRFTARIAVLPLTAMWICIILFMKKTFWNPKLVLNVDVSNAIGGLFSLFFIPIVLAFLAPFICYQHPAGVSSMMSAPTILCGEDEDHSSMVVIGALAFVLLAVPFISGVAWGTYKYRTLVLNQDADNFNRFRFLFVRFRADGYWYGGCLIFRNLLVCIVPIFTDNDPALQVILLCSVLIIFMLVQTWNKPWRPDPSGIPFLDANFSDAALTSGLVVLLVSGALCTDFRTNQASVQMVGMIVLIMFAVIILATGGYALRERLMPRPYYTWFITHHKGGAAAQARYVKSLLSMKTGKKVFIDSDDLQDLDTLFDTVRVRTDVLVVYATAETLKRPWCAGEIVVASRTKTHLVLVRTPSFTDPSAEEMANIAEYLDPSRTILTGYGISTEDVAASYEHLLRSSDVRVFVQNVVPGLGKFTELVDFVLSKRHTHETAPADKLDPVLLTQDSLASLNGTVVLSTDPADDEATAAAGILSSLISPELKANQGPDTSLKPLCITVDYHNLNDKTFGSAGSEQVVDLLCTVIANARAVLVLLSKNTLRSPTQVVVVMEAMMLAQNMMAEKSATKASLTKTLTSSESAEVPVAKSLTSASQAEGQAIIPITLPSFDEFPTSKYYEDVLPHLWLGSEGTEERAAVQTFFKRIAMQFGTHGSETMLAAQAGDILKRIPKKMKKSKTSTEMNLPSRWQINI